MEEGRDPGLSMRFPYMISIWNLLICLILLIPGFRVIKAAAQFNIYVYELHAIFFRSVSLHPAIMKVLENRLRLHLLCPSVLPFFPSFPLPSPTPLLPLPIPLPHLAVSHNFYMPSSSTYQDTSPFSSPSRSPSPTRSSSRSSFRFLTLLLVTL